MQPPEDRIVTLYEALEQYALLVYPQAAQKITEYLRSSRGSLMELQSYLIVPGKLETVLRVHHILLKRTAAEKFAYLHGNNLKGMKGTPKEQGSYLGSVSNDQSEPDLNVLPILTPPPLLQHLLTPTGANDSAKKGSIIPKSTDPARGAAQISTALEQSGKERSPEEIPNDIGNHRDNPMELDSARPQYSPGNSRKEQECDESTESTPSSSTDISLIPITDALIMKREQENLHKHWSTTGGTDEILVTSNDTKNPQETAQLLNNTNDTVQVRTELTSKGIPSRKATDDAQEEQQKSSTSERLTLGSPQDGCKGKRTTSLHQNTRESETSRAVLSARKRNAMESMFELPREEAAEQVLNMGSKNIKQTDLIGSATCGMPDEM